MAPTASWSWWNSGASLGKQMPGYQRCFTAAATPLAPLTRNDRVVGEGQAPIPSAIRG